MMNRNYISSEFYSETSDSIELARFATSEVQFPISNILDLCAGNGVVGIEFVLSKGYDPEIAPKIEFLEFQRCYSEIITANIKKFIPGYDCNIHIADYRKIIGDIDVLGKQDVILCNPPYFDPSEGRLPPNHKKALAKFEIKSSLGELLAFLKQYLRHTPRSCAFITYPRNRWELRSAIELQKQELKLLKIEEVKDIYLIKLGHHF